MGKFKDFFNKQFDEGYTQEDAVKEARDMLSTDSEARYAYYALIYLRIRPREFLEMNKVERAITEATIDRMIEENKIMEECINE